MSELSDTVKSRITKLLDRIANQANDSEAEFTSASTLLQILVKKYMIEEAQLEALRSPETKRDADRGKTAVKLDPEQEWQPHLLRCIAANNFCLGLMRGSVMHIVGRHINAASSVQMFGYLVKAIDRLVKNDPVARNRRTKAHSFFKEGCSDRLRWRLDALRAESVAGNDIPRGDGTSLVLADVYSSEADLNCDIAYGYEPGTTARNRIAQAARWAAEEEARKNAPVVPEKPKTAEERRRDAANERRWKRENEKHSRAYWAKVGNPAYRAGSEAGEAINLDRQIEAEKRAAIA